MINNNDNDNDNDSDNDNGNHQQNIYIVMELLRGDLYDYLNGRSLMSEEVVFKLIEQLTDCLCYLHRKGIIHRDIKVKDVNDEVHNDDEQ